MTPAAITAAAAALDLSPELGELVLVLLEAAPDLAPREALALALALLCLFSLEARGSTRVPVKGELGARALVPLFAEALGAAGLDPSAATELVASLDPVLRGPAAAALVSAAPTERPLVYEPPFLASQRAAHFERRLARALAPRLEPAARAPNARADGALRDILRSPSEHRGAAVVLDAEQRAAALGATAGSFWIVSGGPGTGKTSVALAMLRLLCRLGVDPSRVRLAAPTGKAAFRLSASVRGGLQSVRAWSLEDHALSRALDEGALQATTLHRLLGYGRASGAFSRHAGSPLDVDVVVVDEASMIDLYLMTALVEALPAGARLVLLGDADQLPSVEVGAVLADLVGPADAPPPPWATRLVRSHRATEADPAGRAILAVARAVRQGDEGALRPGGDVVLRAKAEDVRFEGVELFALPTLAPRPALDEVLALWAARFLPSEALVRALAEPVHTERGGGRGLLATGDVGALGAVLDAHARARLLCLGHHGGYGTQSLLAKLHRHARARAPRLGRLSGGDADLAARFSVGEPVIVLQNDYERALWNGDQGVVTPYVDPSGRARLGVAFPGTSGGAAPGARPADGALVVHGLRDLAPRLALAHALTVHKAQGSELDHVALAIPPEGSALLSRELVYTAITRARRGACVIGRPDALQRAAAAHGARYTGLRERLRPGGGPRGG